ncbi:baseplate wedge subunit [Citrobacter phage Ci1]|nr:baseplate wedge subunit [Citrobacter phage Ci1]
MIGNRLKILAAEQMDFYSDIPSDFRRDLKTNDLDAVKNISAVQQSMVGIISTRKGSRPFNPEFGCDIHGSLFENMTDASMFTIEKSITSAIQQFEPRVKLDQVTITPNYDQNEYIVTVYYQLITDLNYIYKLKMGLRNEQS